jgi:hypothetical protein
MQEETEDSNNLYIVKDKENNSFYCGGVSYYTINLYRAKTYGENEIPEEIKNNPNLEIINLDSKEGLEIILNEIHKTEHCMSVKSKSLGETICGLSKLKKLFKKVKKEPY